MNRQIKKLSMGFGNCQHCRSRMSGGTKSYKKYIKSRINRLTRKQYKYSIVRELRGYYSL